MNNKVLIRLIASIVLLIVVVSAYAFWYSVVTAESTAAGDLAAKIIQQSNATSKIAEAKSEIVQLNSQDATMSQYFVETNDLVPFLEQLQSIGKFLGTKVLVESVSATPGTPYGALTLSVSVIGSFDAVLRTIGSIEYEPFNITISSLSFTSPTSLGGTSSSSPQWTGNAVFSIGAKTGGHTVIASSTNP